MWRSYCLAIDNVNTNSAKVTFGQKSREEDDYNKDKGITLINGMGSIRYIVSCHFYGLFLVIVIIFVVFVNVIFYILCPQACWRYLQLSTTNLQVQTATKPKSSQSDELLWRELHHGITQLPRQNYLHN